MKSGLLHERTTTEISSGNLYYELDADRYPRLGNEFFIRLREKYPRAFQRTVSNVQQTSIKSAASSQDNKSVWSLWECNGDYDKAVVKEAGGILIPCSDLSVDERLKRNCDTFNLAKTTGDELLVTLRSFRTELLADSKSVFPRHVAGDTGASYYGDGSTRGSFHVRRDAASNPSTSNSVSRNSSCETKSLQNLPISDAVPCSEVETVGMTTMQSTDCNLQSGTDDTGSVVSTIFNYSSTEHNVLQMQLADLDTSNPTSNSTGLEEDAKNQLVSTGKSKTVSRDTALLMDHSQTCTEQGFEERSASIDAATKALEDSAGTEVGLEVDNSRDIQQLHCHTGEQQLDTESVSCKSTSRQHVITDRKPPVVKKGKTQQRNVKSVFGESTGRRSSLIFNDSVPEVPGSAETVRRKLRLPWRKKKKSYMPGEEMSRWRSNFESWKSASQLSLEAHSESESGTVWRTASQTELQNVDSASVGWTDSDTDTMSDDPLGTSLNERARKLFAFSSHGSVDSSTDIQQCSGRKSSLSSSARKQLSNLQRSARRLLHRQQAVSEHSSAASDFASEQTANIGESSGKRVRHASDSSNMSSRHSDIDSPRHFRPIGRVVSHSVTDNTTTVELIRPPHGPYGIYLARDGNDLHTPMYISRLSDGLPVHFYAGLLRVSDEVLEINHTAVSGLSLDTVFDMIAQSLKLVLLLRPSLPAAAV